MLILGVESSCDETAAAVLNNGKLCANVINSQIDVHAVYGGVVPELASRHHLANIYPVIQEALDQAGISLDGLDGMAVTQGPGLIGALLVGLSFVKAVSLVKKIPYTGVDHLAGHLFSVFLGDQAPSFPFVALVASGGHSSIFQADAPLQYKLLGRSRDDAAGEAFDKVAKLLGLAYPGGPVISKLAEKGNAQAIKFPRAWLEADSLDFSFSGVKTSVVNYVNNCRQRYNNDRMGKEEDVNIEDVCASFQEAVVDVLVEKTILAAKQRGIRQIVAAGGVASNSRLRARLSQRVQQENMELALTPREFCTDNAAMIALAGSYAFDPNLAANSNMHSGTTTIVCESSYDMDAYSRSSFLL
jgi:N6-L-threonylcarbamoyladenine synthase